jgi:hypothetical protein
VRAGEEARITLRRLYGYGAIRIRSRRWGFEGIIWSSEIAIGEFCRLYDQSSSSFTCDTVIETYLLVMTSRRSVRETIKTTIAPVKLAM